MLFRSLLLTYVGWHREDRSFLQELNLEQIAQLSPEIADLIVNGDDKEAIGLLQNVFPNTSNKRAKKAIKELRKSPTLHLVYQTN